MLLPSGGGDAAAAVVPRPCIWSGMMIRTGWLLAAGCLAPEVAGKTAGRHATCGEADVYMLNNVEIFFIRTILINYVEKTLFPIIQASYAMCIWHNCIACSWSGHCSYAIMLQGHLKIHDNHGYTTVTIC